jgi:hypothetical protein
MTVENEFRAFHAFNAASGGMFVVPRGNILTDRSGFINAAATSQLAMSLNPGRSEAFVYNVSSINEPLWINPFSGAAGPNLAGSIRLPQFTGWSGYVTNPIHVYAATSGHIFTAGEF